MTEKRIGMLTPSSNTNIELYTAAMAAQLMPDVSVHYGRVKVTTISLDEASVSQFRDDAMIDAARRLADADVDLLVWNGTSGGWLGSERDREICGRVAEATGIPTTSTLEAYFDVSRVATVKKIALVTPYTEELQKRIIGNFRSYGWNCVADEHLAHTDNLVFGRVPPGEISAMVRRAAANRPDGVFIFCTNFAGPPVVEALEKELGIPVYDSIAVTFWHALRRVGVDTGRVLGWGRVFDC